MNANDTERRSHHMLPTQRTTSGSWRNFRALRFTLMASRMRVFRSVRRKWCSDAYLQDNTTCQHTCSARTGHYLCQPPPLSRKNAHVLHVGLPQPRRKLAPGGQRRLEVLAHIDCPDATQLQDLRGGPGVSTGASSNGRQARRASSSPKSWSSPNPCSKFWMYSTSTRVFTRRASSTASMTWGRQSAGMNLFSRSTRPSASNSRVLRRSLHGGGYQSQASCVPPAARRTPRGQGPLSLAPGQEVSQPHVVQRVAA